METFEGKANVKTVNGQAPDSGGNVNVKEYSHPSSGVTAGTYRKVTVNAQGHVTKGENPTLAISEGGTGATTAAAALKALGIDGAITGLSINGNTITYTKKDSTTGSVTVPTGAGAKAYITSTYISGTNWYRVWSDGWLEQGGVTGALSSGSTTTITFLKAFANTNYIITGGSHPNDSENTLGRIGAFSRTKQTTSITVCNNGWSNNYNAVYVDWYACGQGA